MRDYVHPDFFIMSELSATDYQTDNMEKFKVLEELNIPLNRASNDTKTNALGFSLSDICKKNDLFILNGRYGKDKHIGLFTFRKTSVIDYILSSVDCFRLLKDFSIVETDPLFSDGHALLIWTFNATQNNDFYSEKLQNTRKMNWQKNLSTCFANNVDNEKLEKIISDIGNFTPSPTIIDNVTSQTTDLLLDSANKTFKPKSLEQNYDKPWFVPKCHQMRKKYHVARANYRKLKSTVNKTRLNVASRVYKKKL